MASIRIRMSGTLWVVDLALLSDVWRLSHGIHKPLYYGGK